MSLHCDVGLRFKLKIGVHAKYEDNENCARDATWYCDKMNPHYDAYDEAFFKPRYTIEDIIVAVATGVNVYV